MILDFLVWAICAIDFFCQKVHYELLGRSGRFGRLSLLTDRDMCQICPKSYG